MTMQNCSRTTRTRPRTIARRSQWLAVLVVWCCSSIAGAKPLSQPPLSPPSSLHIHGGAASSNHNNTSSVAPLKSITPKQSKHKKKIIQVYETELWNGKTWKATHRWTTPKGQKSPPPPSIKPPKGYEWEENWKIVTTNRDSMGWEYLWHETQRSCKRRTWLRTAIPKPKKQTTTRPRKQTPKVKSLLQDWNFKGFGWTLYKSLIFKKSFGIALRMPLSTNFDWFDRHPAWPSLTTSVACFYPYSAVCFIHVSVNLEWIQWKYNQVACRVLQCCAILWSVVWWILSIPLYPISHQIPKTKRSNLLQWQNTTLPEPPRYSMELQERVGMSVSWRISQARGYEYRVSYWYLCLPTLFYCGRLLYTPLSSVLQRLEQLVSKKKNNNHKPSVLSQWLRQHTGSLGISTGGPIPDMPYCSLSLVMTLSAFFFQRNKLKSASVQEKEETPPPSVIGVENQTDTTPMLLSSSVVETNNNTSDTVSSSGGAGVRVAS